MKESPAVLIIQTAFIGDVILATSLIESIRKKIPGASVDFVLRKGNEELLAGNPGVRRLWILDKKRKYRSLVQLILGIRRARYDFVINVQRFATTGLMTVFSGAKTTIGFDKNPLSWFFTIRVEHPIGAMHEVSRNLKLLAPLGISEAARPRLYPSELHEAKVKAYISDTFITLSPTSVWFTKQWPAEKWLEFATQTENLKIFLLGAPDDYPQCEEIKRELSAKQVTNLAGKLSLLESAALMKHAQMNFVNDSAPLHLASAMNAPVTAIFCSTVPSFGFGPLSDRSIVVESAETLSCRPCGLHGFRQCPQGHFRCATTILPSQLLSTLG